MMKKPGYRNKDILIIGGEGFIGKNLDWEGAICYDRSHGDDIFQPKLERYIKNSRVVIHLAAITSVEKSFKNPEETFRVNVLGTARVVELCMRYNKKLIFPSSASVYHADLSPYAESKKMAEDIVRKYKRATVLRLYNVFGENMNPNSGSIMYNFLTSEKIVIYGDGEQTRDYIHVDDVKSIIKDAFKKKWEGKVVDVGTGQSYSVNYVASLFAFFRGLEVEYKPPRREVKWSVADTTMLKSLYKKKLKTNLEEGIKELCRI